MVRRAKSTFVRYIYERLTTLAPMNEESAWLNEEKNLIGKKMISRMSASDVSRGLVWCTNNLKRKSL
jgi:hypothetical protein